MGRMREVCGAVSGMFIIAGLLKGCSEVNCDELKGTHYKLIQDLAEEFKKEHEGLKGLYSPSEKIKDWLKKEIYA